MARCYLWCHLQTKDTNMLRQRRADTALKWIMGIKSKMGWLPALPCTEEMAQYFLICTLLIRYNTKDSHKDKCLYVKEKASF